MKKAFSILAAAAALVFAVSCNQNKPTADEVSAAAVKDATALVEAVVAGDSDAIKAALVTKVGAFDALGISDEKYSDLQDLYNVTFDDTLAENGVDEDDIKAVLKKRGIEIPVIKKVEAPEVVAEAEEKTDELAEAAEEAVENAETAATEAVDAIKAAAADAVEVAEEVVEDVEEEVPFILVEKKPVFNGGDPAKEFSKWVGQNINYPESAKEAGISGKVITKFVVAKDGSVKDVKVIKSVNPALDAEAVRVISNSPAWVPGQNGESPVDVSYTFPVVFVLAN